MCSEEGLEGSPESPDVHGGVVQGVAEEGHGGVGQGDSEVGGHHALEYDERVKALRDFCYVFSKDAKLAAEFQKVMVARKAFREELKTLYYDLEGVRIPGAVLLKKTQRFSDEASATELELESDTKAGIAY